MSTPCKVEEVGRIFATSINHDPGYHDDLRHWAWKRCSEGALTCSSSRVQQDCLRGKYDTGVVDQAISMKVLQEEWIL